MDWAPCKTFVRHMIERFWHENRDGFTDNEGTLAGFEKFVEQELQTNPVMHTGFDPAGMTVSFADGVVTLLAASEPVQDSSFATAVTVVTPRGSLQPDTSVPITKAHQRDTRFGIDGMLARPERR